MKTKGLTETRYTEAMGKRMVMEAASARAVPAIIWNGAITHVGALSSYDLVICSRLCYLPSDVIIALLLLANNTLQMPAHVSVSCSTVQSSPPEPMHLTQTHIVIAITQAVPPRCTTSEARAWARASTADTRDVVAVNLGAGVADSSVRICVK